MALSPNDPHSYARPDIAVVTQIHLELFVDFHANVLRGKALLNITTLIPSTEIILDNWGLNIFSVTDIVTGSNLEYNIENYSIYGSKFTIQLPQFQENFEYQNLYKILIAYETCPNSPALYWLEPNQTSGSSSFLISNSKLICARAIFPCQDTPSVKSLYSAQISVPAEFEVIMSGIREKVSDVKIGQTLHRLYEFQQNVPIPSYAVVIVIGLLQAKSLSSISTLWAEKKYIQNTKYVEKCVEIEKMLRIAENFCGPYYWIEHNICVLPPNIPEFQVEYPCVTFVSSTLLDGDYSLISTIFPNIYQSWVGNLITCANFEHFWLTKSFSIFIYGKIMGSMFGLNMKRFLEEKIIKNLKTKTEKYYDDFPFKSLIPDLTNHLPSEAVKYVPYERGYLLLNHLELLLGPKVFELFLKYYIVKFMKTSIRTDDWKNCLYEFFFEKIEMLNSINWNLWFYATDVPIPLNHKKEDHCYILAEKWMKSTKRCDAFYTTVLTSLNDLQKIEFLTYLQTSPIVPSVDKLRELLLVYPFDDSKCCEIRFVWICLCIKSRWKEMVEFALDFACKYGTPKFACPIFEELYKWDEMRHKAIEWYRHYNSKMLNDTKEALKFLLD